MTTETVVEIAAVKFGNVEVIESHGELEKAVVSIGSRGKKLDRDMHVAAVSCLYHARQHGDVTLLEKLVRIMPRSSRGVAFCLWIDAHVPVAEPVSKKLAKVTLKKGRAPEDFLLEEAAATPFWDFTEDKPPVILTLESIIAMTRKRIEQGTKQEGDNAIDATKVAMLEAAFKIVLGEDDDSLIGDDEAEAEVVLAEAA